MINGDLTIHGILGHVAYPQKAANPIHLFSAAMTQLCQIEWDKGNEFFQPTTFQFSNLNSGTGVDNVIPGQLNAKFGFRFSKNAFKASMRSLLLKHGSYCFISNFERDFSS